MADPLLDLETRRRIVTLVHTYPGLHVREVARQLQTSVALVEYHLPVLLENGLLSEERGEHLQRLFPASGRGAQGLGKRERRRVGLLRSRWPLSITLHLLEGRAPLRHRDLADVLGIGKSKLSFHLRKLEAAGIVAKDAEGAFRVADRGEVLKLLLHYPPSPSAPVHFP